IRSARVTLGDFTVLVGPQATGKSLVLQLWKLAVDRAYLLPYLRRAGMPVSEPEAMLDVYFGEGMRSAWTPLTRVETNIGRLPKEQLVSHKGIKPRDQEWVFYIPAHRSLLLANGWPLRFQQLPEAPVVARLFSERLNLALSEADRRELFPLSRKLKAGLRTMVDDAVFHGGKLVLEERMRQRQMRLRYDDTETDLGYMTWTAGQREFVPLLLGLYELLPSGKKPKDDHVRWVIVEEPEMGLHPRAVRAVTFLLLELAHRGYRVMVSTHSPLVLDVLWGIAQIRDSLGRGRQALARVREMFEVSSDPGINAVAASALHMDFRVFALRYGDDRLAEAEDISALDPASSNVVEAGWGGLTGLSSRIAEAVSKAVCEAE
ncbi:MAG TPA: AAA family ATPase, partial [Sandaracinaceae bacterium]